MPILRKIYHKNHKSSKRRNTQEMKRNVLIVGAGGVAHVAAHKFAQNNDLFGDIYIASRSIEACESS